MLAPMAPAPITTTSALRGSGALTRSGPRDHPRDQ
jgi:hypothetical protein